MKLCGVKTVTPSNRHFNVGAETSVESAELGNRPWTWLEAAKETETEGSAALMEQRIRGKISQRVPLLYATTSVKKVVVQSLCKVFNRSGVPCTVTRAEKIWRAEIYSRAAQLCYIRRTRPYIRRQRTLDRYRVLDVFLTSKRGGPKPKRVQSLEELK